MTKSPYFLVYKILTVRYNGTFIFKNTNASNTQIFIKHPKYKLKIFPIYI